MNHFDGLRLPDEHLDSRRDQPWEMTEQGHEHRVKVLRALKAAMVDLHTVKYLTHEDGSESEYLVQVGRLWDDLRSCLTRQDLLRWLIDWAHQQTQDAGVVAIERMVNELELLDDDSGHRWLTQNPG